MKKTRFNLLMETHNLEELFEFMQNVIEFTIEDFESDKVINNEDFYKVLKNIPNMFKTAIIEKENNNISNLKDIKI